jgi:sec-independent protein translocase protein TatA
MSPGIWQILLIIVVIVLLFGAGRLPRIMEDVAKGIKGFKRGMKDDDAEVKAELKEEGKAALSHSSDDVIDAEVNEAADSKD